MFSALVLMMVLMATVMVARAMAGMMPVEFGAEFVEQGVKLFFFFVRERREHIRSDKSSPLRDALSFLTTLWSQKHLDCACISLRLSALNETPFLELEQHFTNGLRTNAQ